MFFNSEQICTSFKFPVFSEFGLHQLHLFWSNNSEKVFLSLLNANRSGWEASRLKTEVMFLFESQYPWAQWQITNQDTGLGHGVVSMVFFFPWLLSPIHMSDLDLRICPQWTSRHSYSVANQGCIVSHIFLCNVLTSVIHGGDALQKGAFTYSSL